MRPIIAMTMGDPAGIGPELIIKVLAHGNYAKRCRPLLIGDPRVFTKVREQLAMDVSFNEITSLAEAQYKPLCLDILRPADLELPEVTFGELNPVYGRAAAVCLRDAWQYGVTGEIQGVVSAPLNKHAFHMAGYDYLDELAFFEDITGSTGSFFMGVMGNVWTVAVAEHIAFKDILTYITKDRIECTIHQMHHTLSRILMAPPRIAVTGLNPHCGEGGLLGTDEIEKIEPAIMAAQRAGINVRGPVPADMVFVQALRGDFDGVVCMYHDHANTARKLQPTNVSATLYMGLPVIGTTTAHGTAFDIAGNGVADPGSFSAALHYAIQLATQNER